MHNLVERPTVKRTNRRLSLRPETVRVLTGLDLNRAVGGEPPQSTDEMTICPAGPSVAPVRCQSINYCDLTRTCNVWCV